MYDVITEVSNRGCYNLVKLCVVALHTWADEGPTGRGGKNFFSASLRNRILNNDFY